MATVVDSRESILRLAARQRRGLAWRHLLPLALALLAMLVCVVGIGETIWPGFRDLVGDRPDTVSARWQVWAEVYVGASVLASLAATRFNVRLALQRLPLVIVLGAIGVAAFLVLWIGSRFLLARGDSSSQGGSPDAAPSADEEVSPRPRPPRNLAAALLTPAEAELVLGKRLAPPMTSGGWVSRSASICRYRTLDGSAFMTFVIHRAISRAMGVRLSASGEPVPGLGDAAFDDGHRLWARAGDWALLLSAWRRDHEPVERSLLVEAARRVIERLPAPYEIEAVERELFGPGLRGRLNSLFALLGLPTRKRRETPDSFPGSAS